MNVMTMGQDAREVKMFGETLRNINRTIASKDSYERLKYAMSVLSDAQEAFSRGHNDTSRQDVNVAKYIIDIVAQELR